jgi:hypothetical protein
VFTKDVDAGELVTYYPGILVYGDSLKTGWFGKSGQNTYVEINNYDERYVKSLSTFTKTKFDAIKSCVIDGKTYSSFDSCYALGPCMYHFFYLPFFLNCRHEFRKEGQLQVRHGSYVPHSTE